MAEISNINQLKPRGQLVIQRLPHVSFFATEFNLPSSRLILAKIETPFKQVAHANAKLETGPFNVTFQVDEDLRNYLEIQDWMHSAGKPEAFSEFRTIKNSEQGLYSDGSLLILDSARVPNKKVEYQRLIPEELSELVFRTTDTDVEYLEATVTFSYYHFNVIDM